MEDSGSHPVLTDPEMDLLRLVCKGMALDEIADHIGTSRSLVADRITLLQERLGVSTRAALIEYGIRQRLAD